MVGIPVPPQVVPAHPLIVVPAHPKLYLRTLLTDLVVLMRCLQLAQGQCLQGVGISLSSELKTEDITKHPKEFLFV